MGFRLASPGGNTRNTFSGVPSAYRAALAAALTIAALIGTTQNSVAADQVTPSAIVGLTAPGIQLAALGGATQTTLRSVTIKKGGTLEGAIRSAGGSRAEAYLAIRALTKLFNPRTLQPGQEIEMRFVTENGTKRLWSVRVKRTNNTGYAAVAEVAGTFFSRNYKPSDDLDILLPRPLDVAQGAIATRSVNVARDQTLMEVALQLGANRTEADKAIQALSRLFNPRKLQIGQEVTATFGKDMRLLGLSVSMGDDEVAALLFDGKVFEPLRTIATQRVQFLAAVATPATSPATSPAGTPNDDDNGPLVGFNHFAQSLIVSRGDTLIDSAVELGASQGEALAATRALDAIFNARHLKIGQVITATFGRTTPEGAPRLLAFSVAISANAEAAAFLSESGEYSSRKMTKAESEVLVADLAVPAATVAPRPALPTPPLPPSFDWVATIDFTVTVYPGDTLMEAVLSVGATPTEAHEAIQALTKIFDPRRLMVGQDIRVTFADEDLENPNARLLAINVAVDVDREMAAIRSEAGGFAPFEIIKELDRQYVRASSTIDSNLFLAAERAGVPANTLMELIRIYSWDVDFQRDIRDGDSFEVFFEMLHDAAGNPVKEGNILYAQMTLSGTSLPLYRYEDADGIIDYYNGDGHSVRKALLRTPVDGARLSSGFGMRLHPIAGYSRMHQGIDFAAPSGTPIKAAGDGVIEVAGRNGGYGNYIRIRHNSEHKTAYAHMKKFASGIRVGARVRQGQTIGYVGTTGSSTGPHLHYEVMVNNAQVNPMSLKLPTGRRLVSSELAVFTETRLRIDAEWDRAAAIVDLATTE